MKVFRYFVNVPYSGVQLTPILKRRKSFSGHVCCRGYLCAATEEEACSIVLRKIEDAAERGLILNSKVYPYTFYPHMHFGNSPRRWDKVDRVVSAEYELGDIPPERGYIEDAKVSSWKADEVLREFTIQQIREIFGDLAETAISVASQRSSV